MYEDECVYCVQCKHFLESELIDDIDIGVCWVANCKFEGDCYHYNCEDGAEYWLRHHYEPK